MLCNVLMWVVLILWCRLVRWILSVLKFSGLFSGVSCCVSWCFVIIFLCLWVSFSSSWYLCGDSVKFILLSCMCWWCGFRVRLFSF